MNLIAPIRRIAAPVAVFILASMLFTCVPQEVFAASKCGNKGLSGIMNAICWDCIYPIKIGDTAIVDSPLGFQDPQPPPYGASETVCMCYYGEFLRVGIVIGLWEPFRLCEVVMDPWCFPALKQGGVRAGFAKGRGESSAQIGADQTHDQASFYNVHWYIFPLWAIMGVLLDSGCWESNGADIAYITEIDPLWQPGRGEKMAAIITPEAVLFSKIATYFVGMVNVIASALDYPIELIFWTPGSWTNIYPLAGVIHGKNIVEEAGGIVARMIFKLHRELILWYETSVQYWCGQYPVPIWRMGFYRYQLVDPVPAPTCMVVGKPGLMSAANKSTGSNSSGAGGGGGASTGTAPSGMGGSLSGAGGGMTGATSGGVGGAGSSGSTSLSSGMIDTASRFLSQYSPWTGSKDPPTKGDNFTFIVFKMRRCCYSGF